MCSYNAVNGEPMCTNRELISGILRDEFGFTVSNPHLILIILTPKSSPNPHLILTSSSSSQAEATAYEKQRHHRAWLEIDSAHGLSDLTLNATVIALPGSGGKSFALNGGFSQVHFY